jgi:hypothetical protein
MDLAQPFLPIFGLFTIIDTTSNLVNKFNTYIDKNAYLN